MCDILHEIKMAYKMQFFKYLIFDWAHREIMSLKSY